MRASVAGVSRSGRRVFAHESRTALQPLRLALSSRSLIRNTTNPSTMIVLPGLGGGDSSTIDDHTPTAVNVEVDSSHLGLGIDPDVWRIVATAIEELP